MGEPLPHYYRRCLDPFVALMAAAAVTPSVCAWAPGICLVAQRDPIVTAKQVATLDLLSGGRFTFGVGFGWNVEEAADHGVDWPTRRDTVREHVLAMRELWTNEEVASSRATTSPSTTAGSGPSRCSSRTRRSGWASAPARRTSRTWPSTPTAGSRSAAAAWREALPELRAGIRGRRSRSRSLRHRPVWLDARPGKFEYFAELGVTEVVANCPPGTADEVIPFLDNYAAVAQQLTGQETSP